MSGMQLARPVISCSWFHVLEGNTSTSLGSHETSNVLRANRATSRSKGENRRGGLTFSRNRTSSVNLRKPEITRDIAKYFLTFASRAVVYFVRTIHVSLLP